MHGRFNIGLLKIHRRFHIGPPKMHRGFRIDPPKIYLNFLSPEFHRLGILFTIAIMKEKQQNNLFEIEWPILVSKWKLYRTKKESWLQSGVGVLLLNPPVHNCKCPKCILTDYNVQWAVMIWVYTIMFSTSWPVHSRVPCTAYSVQFTV